MWPIRHAVLVYICGTIMCPVVIICGHPSNDHKLLSCFGILRVNLKARIS